MDPKIFKAYDVRGIYPTEIDESAAYKIGKAFVTHLQVKEVAVGYDMRTAVPKLLPFLHQGIADAGAKIIDLGLIGTELMYFSVGNFGYESGIMLTASHNPSEYIGMKMVKKGAAPIGIETGLKEIAELAQKIEESQTKQQIVLEKQDPYQAYRDKINSIVDLSKLEHKKIVVDAGNGIGGHIFEKLFSGTNLEVVPMYFEPDGTFPNHVPDPMKEENIVALSKRVLEEKADLGIGLDGDADRCFFIDETGQGFLGYFVVAILAELMLKKYPGSKIVHETRLYWAIEDKLKELGGIPVKSIAGHSFMKAKMREVDSVFSGETSSHFFYRDLYFADSSFLTIALILEMLQNKNEKLSEVMNKYKNKYFISGEKNYKVSDADSILNKIETFYSQKGFLIDKFDGIAIDNNREWHISLRKSNTEPLVRLNVEAKDQQTVSDILAEAEKIILS